MASVFRFPKINWYPGHMHKASKTLKSTIQNCDMLLEVRDARIPLTSANIINEELTREKQKIIILNKLDLCSVTYTRVNDKEKHVKKLEEEGKKVFMLSTLTEQNINTLIEYLKSESNPKFNTIGTWMLIAGLPNVGKSSIINLLRNKSNSFEKKSPSRVGAEPCVTKGVSSFKVSLNPLLYIFDSPGVGIPKFEDSEQGMKLALTGAIKDDIVGVEIICDYLLFTLNEHHIYDYVEKFKLKEPAESMEVVLEKLKNHFNWDETAICRYILMEYRKGNLGRVTLDKLS